MQTIRCVFAYAIAAEGTISDEFQDGTEEEHVLRATFEFINTGFNEARRSEDCEVHFMNVVLVITVIERHMDAYYDVVEAIVELERELHAVVAACSSRSAGSSPRSSVPRAVPAVLILTRIALLRPNPIADQLSRSPFVRPSK